MTAARRSVLVVDDHPMSRLLLVRVLQLAGFEVLEAGCIAIADRIAHARHPDAVVLDLRLPDGDGADFAHTLRAGRETAACAIVACTAAATLEDEERAIAAGCDAFVRKPIETRGFPVLLSSLVGPGSGSVAA